MSHFFPALDKTAKRRRPKAGTGERIRGFIADQEDIISAIAVGTVLRNVQVNGVGLPEAIYKFARNSISHEGELDRRLENKRLWQPLYRRGLVSPGFLRISVMHRPIRSKVGILGSVAALVVLAVV